MAQRVGFIGAGLMGHGMAKNIVEKGYRLAVLAHRNRAPIDDLLTRGASEAESPAALARASDLVILCVPSSAEVELCVFGEHGLLGGAHDGLIVVDCTTAEPASTERVAKALAARNVRFADAPLTRSPKDAEAGRLNTLVGADAATLAAIRPVLETFSENVFHIGPVGAGHTLKLINNFLSQGIAALIAEAVTTATKAGVDLATMFEVVSAGGANSSVFQRFMPWVLSGDSGMVFKLKNGQKDVRYYTHLAEAVGSTAFLGEAVHQDLHAGRRSGRERELRAGARPRARPGEWRRDRPAGVARPAPFVNRSSTIRGDSARRSMRPWESAPPVSGAALAQMYVEPAPRAARFSRYL